VLYQRFGTRQFALLVNMAKDSNEARDVYKRLSNATNHFLDLPIEYLGYIPYDQNVTRAVKKQRLLAEAFPDSKAIKSMSKIVKALCRKEPNDPENSTIKFFGRPIIDQND